MISETPILFCDNVCALISMLNVGCTVSRAPRTPPDSPRSGGCATYWPKHSLFRLYLVTAWCPPEARVNGPEVSFVGRESRRHATSSVETNVTKVRISPESTKIGPWRAMLPSTARRHSSWQDATSAHVRPRSTDSVDAA